MMLRCLRIYVALLLTLILSGIAVARPWNIFRPAPTFVPEPEPTAVDPEATKYFHEPGDTDILGHYDVRFFHGTVNSATRAESLTHMVKAYLTTFENLGLETWLAHGTLLGWWWNGKMLPWDWDIDTQVSDSTLAYMAEHYNNTYFQYNSSAVYAKNDHDANQFERKYLLDVNPWQLERDRGQGMNIIDARWIDTETGLYIDVTGLSEVHPDTQPGILSCKNWHRYRINELYPLRKSTYEGVPAYIPYEYLRILEEEYNKKALTQTQFHGHHWDPEKAEWIRGQFTNVGAIFRDRGGPRRPFVNNG